MNAFESIAQSRVATVAGCQHGATKGDIWGMSLRGVGRGALEGANQNVGRF